jgi:Protein HRI1
MSISTRVSISWPPKIPPQELTNTLVLNFPSGHFIDLGPLKTGEGLDWGMAGRQIITETDRGTKSMSPWDRLISYVCAYD